MSEIGSALKSSQMLALLALLSRECGVLSVLKRRSSRSFRRFGDFAAVSHSGGGDRGLGSKSLERHIRNLDDPRW